jgi:4'-phosphopantetheinyl transferase
LVRLGWWLDGARTGLPAADRRVHILLASPEEQEEVDLEAAWSTLDLEERARAERFHLARDRTSYVVAHGLLRAAVGHYTNTPPSALRFERTADGRPELDRTHSAGSSVRFSLAHTRGLVGCAVTSGADVGFDVEVPRSPAPMEVAAQYFSSRERAQLESLTPAEQADRFHMLWTLKESYLKALGVGLMRDLGSFDVTPTADGGAELLSRTAPGDDQRPWTLRWWRLGEHWMALSVQEPPEKVDVVVSPAQRLAGLLAPGPVGPGPIRTVRP